MTRDGYILPFALVAIAVIAIVSATAAGQVQRASHSIGQLADRSRMEAGLISAEQTMLYLMLTEPMGSQGIEVGGTGDPFGLAAETSDGIDLVRADGSPRSFGERAVITRLFDDQSFLNFASANEAVQVRNLSMFGVSRAQAERLAATLADYQDTDDLRRLGGAEARDYPAGAAPANRPIRDVLEVCSVMGWSETEVCDDPGKLLLVGRTRYSDALNPRLPSLPLLQMMLGDDADAGAAYRAMQQLEIGDFATIGRPEFDVESDPLSGPGYPGPTLILMTHPLAGSPIRRTVVELNTGSIIAPFFIHSKYVMGGGEAQDFTAVEDVERVEELPEPATDSRSGGR